MAEATGWIVADLCRAQAKLDEAAQAIISARVNAQRINNHTDSFQSHPLDRRLSERTDAICELEQRVERDIADMAALIPRQENPDG